MPRKVSNKKETCNAQVFTINPITISRPIFIGHIHEHSIEACREPMFSSCCCVTVSMDHITGILYLGAALRIWNP